MRIFFCCVLLALQSTHFCVLPTALQSQEVTSKYPADISFMVADLKYNQKEGIKFCEVQHGILSTFYGDKFTEGNSGVISGKFLETLSQFNFHGWALGKVSAEQEIAKKIKNSSDWTVKKNLGAILTDPVFIKNAKLSVNNPYDLNQYHGFLYIRQDKLKDIEKLKKDYPGILIMDSPSYDYWIDKYKMSKLFNRTPALAKYKPKWGLYSKKYDENLAKTICDDLKCNTFVIKPRSSFLGKGVIIVSQQNLDNTLKYILTRTEQLKANPDKSYNYWYHDFENSFIVEEFISSDPITVPHLDNKLYQPTLRAAVVLTYHQQKISIEFLSAYWLVPEHPMEDKESLNACHKAYCKVPYFSKVDPETLSKIKEQVLDAFQLLYTEMLKGE